MFNYFKADFFRATKESSFRGTILLIVAISLVFSYLFRNESGQEGYWETQSMLTSFIPLYFMSITNFFWGEDIYYRTINNVIIKSNSRSSIFIYKVAATLITSFAIILLNLCLIAIIRGIIGFQVSGYYLFTIFCNQLPIYSCLIMLCIFIFIYLDRSYQAYISYIIIILLFDQLFGFVIDSMFETNFMDDFLMMTNLKEICVNDVFFTKTSSVALVFSLVYFSASYTIFIRKEFK